MRGLVIEERREHMSQKHGGQPLTQESVAQLRQLDRAACVICGTIRSRRGNRCNHCKAGTATRDIIVGDIFQERRQPGHRSATTCRPTLHPSKVILPDDSLLPNSPIRDIVITERDAQLPIDFHRA